MLSEPKLWIMGVGVSAALYLYVSVVEFERNTTISLSP